MHDFVCLFERKKIVYLFFCVCACDDGNDSGGDVGNNGVIAVVVITVFYFFYLGITIGIRIHNINKGITR